MKKLLVAMMAGAMATAVMADDYSKIHGQWMATHDVDEFTGNESCAVHAMSDDNRFRGDTLTIPTVGAVTGKDGSLIDVDYVISSSVGDPVISGAMFSVDGDVMEFDADLLDAMRSGNKIKVRFKQTTFGISEETKTKQFSLVGFTAAWEDASSRCK